MGILNQTEETVAPTNPDALRRLLYPKSSGWIDRDSTGAEKQLATLTGNFHDRKVMASLKPEGCRSCSRVVVRFP